MAWCARGSLTSVGVSWRQVRPLRQLALYHVWRRRDIRDAPAARGSNPGATRSSSFRRACFALRDSRKAPPRSGASAPAQPIAAAAQPTTAAAGRVRVRTRRTPLRARANAATQRSSCYASLPLALSLPAPRCRAPERAESARLRAPQDLRACCTHRASRRPVMEIVNSSMTSGSPPVAATPAFSHRPTSASIEVDGEPLPHEIVNGS